MPNISHSGIFAIETKTFNTEVVAVRGNSWRICRDSSDGRSMRSLWRILFLLGFACSASLAQLSLNKQVNQVFVLEQQGQFADAIGVGQRLISSNALSEVARGKTWTLLGIAYLQENNLREAQNAFEHAIHVFENQPEYREDYAADLCSLADVYQNLGQLQIASRLAIRSLVIYRQTEDHTAIVRVASNIAGLEVSLGRRKEGKQYLEEALKESKLATDLNGDDYATIFSIEGWLATLHHDRNAALTYYQRSLEIWKHIHGEEHQLTGWGHVLFGRSLADTPDKTKALDEARSGLSILDRTVGHQNPRYFAAQLAYSYVLDANGLHKEAFQTKTEAQKGISNFYRDECTGCTVSVLALQ